MPKTESGMELSKIGPPPKSRTATVSGRRRPESLREPGVEAASAAAYGPSAAPEGAGGPAGPPAVRVSSGIAAALLLTLLQALKPPSVVRSCPALMAPPE